MYELPFFWFGLVWAAMQSREQANTDTYKESQLIRMYSEYTRIILEKIIIY